MKKEMNLETIIKYVEDGSFGIQSFKNGEIIAGCMIATVCEQCEFDGYKCRAFRFKTNLIDVQELKQFFL